MYLFELPNVVVDHKEFKSAANTLLAMPERKEIGEFAIRRAGDILISLVQEKIIAPDIFYSARTGNIHLIWDIPIKLLFNINSTRKQHIEVEIKYSGTAELLVWRKKLKTANIDVYSDATISTIIEQLKN